MLIVVVDEAELPESIHEEADPRTGRPYHFCKISLTQSGDWNVNHFFFVEIRHQQKSSRQPFLAAVEKLIDQIILIADDSLQQMVDKGGRQFWFPTHGLHHRLFLDMQKDAVGHCNCGRRPYQLTSKTTLPKEIVFAQNAKDCF